MHMKKETSILELLFHSRRRPILLFSIKDERKT